MTRRLGWAGWTGAALLALFVGMALFGPWVAPHSATRIDLDHRLLGPSGTYWLGTDDNGVDLLSQILSGARIELLVAGITVLLCATIGVAMGTIAGYFGGRVDDVIMRVVDVLMAFPGLLLNLAIVAVVKRPSTAIVVFAL